LAHLSDCKRVGEIAFEVSHGIELKERNRKG
jgi:hypothetical protein